MIPDKQEVFRLWDVYNLPLYKQVHCRAVVRTAQILCQAYTHTGIAVNRPCVEAAALLHDIDKNIPKLPGEQHPDAGVRILKKEGMNEVAEVVRTHPLHTILDEAKAPKTYEQKIVYLADKMTKDTCIGVEKRFALWRKEDTDPQVVAVLDACYPKVIALRDTMLSQVEMTEEQLIKLAR